MESEELSQELLEKLEAEQARELPDEQLEELAGGADGLPNGACPKAPNGGGHDWALWKSWPDGRFRAEIWYCKRCDEVYRVFV